MMKWKCGCWINGSAQHTCNLCKDKSQETDSGDVIAVEQEASVDNKSRPDVHSPASTDKNLDAIRPTNMKRRSSQDGGQIDILARIKRWKETGHSYVAEEILVWVEQIIDDKLKEWFAMKEIFLQNENGAGETVAKTYILELNEIKEKLAKVREALR